MTQDAIRRLQKLDYLIQIKGTGTPAQLAERLGISERSIYTYINQMKDLGAPIKFDNYRQSYYYDEEGSFIISFLPIKKMQQVTVCILSPLYFFFSSYMD